MKKKIKIKGTSYTHKILWPTAKYQMEAAKQLPERKKYFYLSAMVMAFFTLESYLNYLGEIIDPTTWKSEKLFFTEKPYIGTLGKLSFLINKLGMLQFDRGKRPYQTIKQLKRIRDFLVHGRTEKYNGTVKYKDGSSPDLDVVKSYLEKHISERKANIALEDTEQIIKELHHKAAKTHSQCEDFTSEPLDSGYYLKISDSFRI
ncbi:MAG: hypothetical protein Q8M71_07580 [Thermodesulfovibrionales bacterium]|nr:hypothetical protein [Thermodesulfovibrionales bacterium]